MLVDYCAGHTTLSRCRRCVQVVGADQLFSELGEEETTGGTWRVLAVRARV